MLSKIIPRNTPVWRMKMLSKVLPRIKMLSKVVQRNTPVWRLKTLSKVLLRMKMLSKGSTENDDAVQGRLENKEAPLKNDEAVQGSLENEDANEDVIVVDNPNDHTGNQHSVENPNTDVEEYVEDSESNSEAEIEFTDDRVLVDTSRYT
ncbi:hypothetical protein MMC13_008458 [Lambiella insularis]|nr:hypothetical protein [Lambiella insularis]